MSEIDQQFIEYVVKSLVSKPDAVSIERSIDEKGVLLELTVDPEDLGRVIGKRGATAQSLRTLLRALGTKNDARYNLKIVDNGVGSHSSSGDSSSSRTDDNRSDDSSSSSSTSDGSNDSSNDNTSSDDSDNSSASSSNDKHQSDEEEASDRLRQTREELADLDDLDV